jgi:hypothetical protein
MWPIRVVSSIVDRSCDAGLLIWLSLGALEACLALVALSCNIGACTAAKANCLALAWSSVTVYLLLVYQFHLLLVVTVLGVELMGILKM